jgi:hypothetical protein
MVAIMMVKPTDDSMGEQMVASMAGWMALTPAAEYVMISAVSIAWGRAVYWIILTADSWAGR